MTIYNIKTNKAVKYRQRARKKALRIISSALLADIWSCDDEIELKEIYARRRKRISCMRKQSTKKRKFRKRQSWQSFEQKLSDRHFRRYFRIDRVYFQYLCERIEGIIGKSTFQSEKYLHDLRLGRICNRMQS